MSILKSISVSNNHNERNVERTPPAIIVIDQRGAFHQLTPMEVRELYASIRYSDDVITDSSIYDAADMGQGYTSEELFNAVSVVMGASVHMQDRKKAGEVLSHFDGADIFISVHSRSTRRTFGLSWFLLSDGRGSVRT